MFQNKKLSIVFQVLSIVLFSLISAALPQYAWVVFILYFVVLMAITSRSSMRGLGRRGGLKGTPLFREENAVQVMTRDVLLIQEIKEQFKSTMVLLTLPLLIIFIAPIYWDHVNPILVNNLLKYIGHEFIERFLSFLLFYVFLIAIISLPRIILMHKLKQKKQLYTPRVFHVYRNSLYIDGRILDYSKDMCFKHDPRRKFVEVRSPRLPFDIRLYTLETSTLANRFKEVGLSECRE